MSDGVGGLPGTGPTVQSAAQDPHALDRPMVTSVAWTGGVKWILSLFTWVATLIVASVLAPEDFGLVGMAGILTGLLTILAEFGLGITVITLRDLTSRQIAQLNGLALLLGTAAVVMCLLLAIPAGMFFRAPSLPLVIIVLSGTFLISSMRTIPAALMQRELAFRRLALTEGAYGLVQSATTIGFALGGFGYWALVLGPIVGQAVYTMLILLQRRHALALPRRSELGGALSFTRHQLTGTLAWYGYTNADSLIAGRVLGPAGLGVYSMAFTLARAVPEKVSSLVVRVMPAFFSAVQEDTAALRRYLLRLTEYLSLLMLPALTGLALIAPDVIAIIGQQWSEAVTPLRILAVFAAFEGVLQLVHRVLTAKRRTRFLMYDGLALLIIMPAGFLVGSRWGVNGIAAAWLVLYPLTRLPVLLVVRKVAELPLREYFRAWFPAISGCVAMSAALLGVRPLILDWPLGLRIGFQVALGAAAYFAVIVVLFMGRLRGLHGLLLQLRRPA